MENLEVLSVVLRPTAVCLTLEMVENAAYPTPSHSLDQKLHVGRSSLCVSGCSGEFRFSHQCVRATALEKHFTDFHVTYNLIKIQILMQRICAEA